MKRQLGLDLAYPGASGRADFLTADCNRAALAWIERWPDWPGRTLALHGPAGSGKTHLARLWCTRSGGTLVDGSALAEDAAARAGGAVAIDDADRAPEAALLHLYNASREGGGSVLIVARQPPAAWPIALPDLASRLRALPIAATAAPDDAMLAAILVKHFQDRQVPVPPAVIDYVVPRIERSFAAAAAFARELDRLAIAERVSITLALARRALALAPG